MYGEKIQMDEETKKLRNGLPPSVWLNVISQIMTRLNSKITKKGKNMSGFIMEIKDLLLRLARSDFHSMIFPLLFSSSNENKKSKFKKYILDTLKSDNKKKNIYNDIIETYKRFTREMINVSIIMEEKWNEELNSILKYYQKDKKGNFNQISVSKCWTICSVLSTTK
jgi:hypothetical protein